MNKRPAISLSFLLLASPLLAKIYEPPLSMVVKADVADVRAKPIAHIGGYDHDDLQETQVEKGEPVLVFERKGKWARIEATDQMEFTHADHWQGYPGWVLWSALTDKLKELKELKPVLLTDDGIRKLILEKASLHIGESYFWGGRSLHNPTNKTTLTGVDCSGLINLAFRQAGIAIPRDAHEQYMRARPIEGAIKPADLIFLAKVENPRKIVHVAFYVEEDDLLEAPQTGEKVRRISFKERFGKKKTEIKTGDVIGDRIIYFGTLLAEKP